MCLATTSEDKAHLSFNVEHAGGSDGLVPLAGQDPDRQWGSVPWGDQWAKAPIGPLELQLARAGGTVPAPWGQYVRGGVIDGCLVCPRHRYRYDLETGRGRQPDGGNAAVYPTEVRNDAVFIGVGRLTLRLFGRDLW